jgi:hypothetical protein
MMPYPTRVCCLNLLVYEALQQQQQQQQLAEMSKQLLRHACKEAKSSTLEFAQYSRAEGLIHL